MAEPIDHAGIKSLETSAMTIAFVFKGKTMLDERKAGDKIKFKAINDAGKCTVTDVQMAQ